MTAVFYHVFNVILPVLLCIAVGFGLAQFKQPFDNRMVTSLMANVGYPALILSHLLGHSVNLQVFFEMMLAALLAIICAALVWACILRLLGVSLRVFLSPLSLNNVGNIGLPVCSLVVGSQGITYGLAFVVVVIVLTFTVSQWITSGNYSLRKLVSSPAVYAAVLAVLMLMAGMTFPQPVMASLDILGGLAIPLMLITLGYSLATLELGSFWFALRMSLLHLVVAATVAYGVVALFGLSGVARSVFIIQCLMPVSAASYLWVEMYRPQEAPAVAGLILVTSLLTIIVLPLALTYWI